MFNIRDFLKRATGKQGKELFFRKTVQDVILKYLKIELPFGSISIKGSGIRFKGISQSGLSTIYIKKQQIIKEINELQDVYIVKDIR